MNRKLLKKDLLALLERMENTTEKFKIARFGKLSHESGELPLWAAPELHDLNAAYAQAMVEFMFEFHKALQEKKDKAYYHDGYDQIFKGRNQYNARYCR